jgi:energy-coupling factor transporter ATP-binding protein EcfA2
MSSKDTKELNLTLTEFNPLKQLKTGRNIFIVGSSGSGKSHMLKHLLTYVAVPLAILVNPTEFADNRYGNILPEQCKLDEITDSVLEKICNRQKALCKWMQKHPEVSIDPNACLIMDKCEPDFIDLKWAHNPSFKFLFRSGKVAHINMIFTANYPLPLPPHYLPAIDYVFILNETNPKHRKKLWEMFGGRFKDFKQFSKVMEKITTERYSAMVIDMTKTSGKLDQHIFFYKAPPEIPERYLGCKNLYRMCVGNEITFYDLMDKPLELFRKQETPDH